MASIQSSLRKGPEREAQLRAIFGAVLRAFRMQQGLTQEELGIRCAMDRSFISDLERGAREPGLFTILRLAHGLDTSAVDIIGALEAKTRAAGL